MGLINLTGARFGRLVVLQRDNDTVTPNGKKRVKWLCRCDCGNTVSVRSDSLRNGLTTSCGCLNRENCSKINYIHGKSKTRLHKVWRSMKDRCYNPNCISYPDYGGRGITICESWLNSFMNFYDWAMASGYNQEAQYGECTIDRINNSKGYSPDNCRWVDMTVQSNNRRVRRITT